MEKGFETPTFESLLLDFCGRIVQDFRPKIFITYKPSVHTYPMFLPLEFGDHKEMSWLVPEDPRPIMFAQAPVNNKQNLWRRPTNTQIVHKILDGLTQLDRVKQILNKLLLAKCDDSQTTPAQSPTLQRKFDGILFRFVCSSVLCS